MSDRPPIPRKSFCELSAKQKRENLRFMNSNQPNDLRLDRNEACEEMPIQVKNLY